MYKLQANLSKTLWITSYTPPPPPMAPPPTAPPAAPSPPPPLPSTSSYHHHSPSYQRPVPGSPPLSDRRWRRWMQSRWSRLLLEQLTWVAVFHVRATGVAESPRHLSFVWRRCRCLTSLGWRGQRLHRAPVNCRLHYRRTTNRRQAKRAAISSILV